MKRILAILLLLPFILSAQTTNLTFSNIPFGNADLQRPGAGANEWSYDQNIVNIPVQGTNTPRLDRYWRFNWRDFQTTGSSSTYSFTTLDQKIQQSIDNGQGFSFGVMQLCSACDIASNINVIVSGAKMMYPDFLHTLMQAEATKDYISGGAWIPNYNSANYLTALKNLNIAINNHLLTTSYKGVRFQDVIDFVDIRGYGDYGEWTNNTFTAGTLSVASGDSIISYHVHVFDKFQCVYMIATLDGNQLSNTMVAPAIGYYALMASNSVGKLGWRRDNWGWVDGYIHSWLELNNTTFGGIVFKDSIMKRYLYAPVVGEPADCNTETNFSQLAAQGTLYGGNSFGNGNLNCGVNATIQNNFRLASKTFGYRLNLNVGGTGSITGSQAGGPFQIVQRWRNVGVSPSYQNWNCIYDLRTGPTAAPVWSGTSSFNPRLFSPAGSDNVVTDNFTLTSVPAGTYELHMTMKDPLGYRFPMPIYITNTQQADGSYIILTNIVIGTSGAIANAGPNQNITTSSVTLSGSSSTGATSYLWTRISGPNTPTITTPTTVGTTVTGLVNGTYVFQLGINGGVAGSLIDQVQVVVAIPPVVANAGANQAIVLPTSSTTVSGSLSSGPITTYAWSNVSGPNTPTITTPSAVSTTITGLVAGTYIVRLTLNGSVTDDVQITVSASPVASAGPDQIVQLPTSSATVNGSGSTGASTYAWTRISGPNTPTITTPTAVSTTITGLVAGTYVFRLTINGGPTDDVTITVNPVPVVANAGNNQTITLPTSSVTLSGSASTGTITTYAWTNVSGPNTPTITTPTTVGTTVTGLIAGTYVFQLSVNAGASISQVQVKVLPAPLPIANAGVSQTITLPTASVNVSGSGSSGNITAYAWSMLSGPNAAVFGTASSVSTTVTGLIEGIYLIQLALNGGAAIDTMRIYVNPAAPPVPSGQTIFTTQTPVGGLAAPTQNDGNQGGLTGIELGNKFRASVNGYVLGIRYFKTNQVNGGTKIGELYSYPGGVRLGSATFVNESVTGWQTAVFATPVFVTAGTTYIAAYFSPNGNYVSTTNYMTTAVVNGFLTALADGTDGPNGVYKYSNSAAFPNANFQKSNYWVDPLFSSPNTNPCNCHPRNKWEQTRTLNGF